MNVVILGGGLSALSLAYNLQKRDDINRITIIEKEDRVGGLCKSYKLNDAEYDIGPHIIFSRDEEVLEHMKWLLTDNYHTMRRSNMIIHDNRLIQYPFENDLSKLGDSDKFYAVNSFVNNPYENYSSQNMNQFFLKTFGDGITNLYLRPYNEKIWKFSPCFMNTMMVERIPKPSYEDIMRSANGETVDGYLHQLYFSYPDKGGIEALINSYMLKFGDKVSIVVNADIKKIIKKDDIFKVYFNDEVFECDRLVSTIPINEFCFLYGKTPKRVRDAAINLKYNSIMIGIVQVSKDLCGDNFAFYVADSEVIFHRVSKINFLHGENKDDIVTYMVEITYRKDDIYDKMDDDEIISSIVSGLKKISFIDDNADVLDVVLKKFKYAYVIYDIDYKKNIDIIRKYYDRQNIYLHGRFGNFEYINMDKVIRNSIDLSGRIK